MSEVTFNRDGLRLQLERARFERALEVCESMVSHRVLLTNSELVRLNNILTGHQPTDDPWRQGPMSITLRSGKQVQFSVMADPKVSLRDQLHQATAIAEAGKAPDGTEHAPEAVIDAAIAVYVNMVLSHYFQDANRRTAVLAAHYFLRRYGLPVSGLAIHEMGLGDVREAEQVELLRQTLRNMAKLR
jgi:prophage maintenance system killer protein